MHLTIAYEVKQHYTSVAVTLNTVSHSVTTNQAILTMNATTFAPQACKIFD